MLRSLLTIGLLLSFTLFVFSIPISEVTESCTQTVTCVKSEGKSCKGDIDLTNPEKCKGVDCCARGLKCNVNGTCAKDNLGDPCKQDSDCFYMRGELDLVSGFQPTSNLKCHDKVCRMIGQVGDACNDDDKICESGLTCNNSSDVCTGLPEGHSCLTTGPQLCDFGLFCDQGLQKCVKTLAEGEACTSESVCAPGTFCYKESEQKLYCRRLFNVTINETCLQDFECTPDAYCDYDTVKMIGTCRKGETFSFEKCNNGTCDDAGSVCKCISSTGKSMCIPLNSKGQTNCRSKEKDAYDCWMEHNCTVEVHRGQTNVAISLLPNSCAMNKCKSVTKSYEKCYCSNIKDLYGDCVQCWGGFPLWLLIVLIVVAVILVILIIALIAFCIMRSRRRNYQQI